MTVTPRLVSRRIDVVAAVAPTAATVRLYVTTFHRCSLETWHDSQQLSVASCFRSFCTPLALNLKRFCTGAYAPNHNNATINALSILVFFPLLFPFFFLSPAPAPVRYVLNTIECCFCKSNRTSSRPISSDRFVTA